MEDDKPLAEQVELEPDLAPGMEPPEGESVRRFIKQSALQQGSTIPAGWKPTVQKPVPVVRCVHIFKDGHEREGERCGRWSLRGSRLCYEHGGRGNLRNVEEYRKSIIEAARLQLTEHVPDALATLFDLADNATGENVKLKAATEVLDRAGLKSAEQLDVDITVHEADPAVALAQRLAQLKKAADIVREKEQAKAERVAEEIRQAESEALAITAGGPDDSGTDADEIIDAEIVEE